MKYGVYLLAAFLIVASNSFGQNKYTVNKGDTLYSISKQFKITINELKELNNLNSNNLRIGSILSVPSSYSSYIVKSGDTLGAIAQKHGLNSSKDLIAANKLQGTQIRVGQKLLIPNKKASTSTSSTKVNSNKGSYYTVESGDHLIYIADKFGVSVKSLKEVNKLESDELKIGQRVYIPSSNNVVTTVKKAKEQVKKQPENTTEEVEGTYVVKSGDTLSQIAERFGVSTKDLKEYNNLEGNNIIVGQNLILPYITKVVKPDHSIKKETEKAASKSTVTAKTKYTFDYKVKSNDTLSNIAERFNVKIADIRNENDLSNNIIYVGQKLKIPTTKQFLASKKAADQDRKAKKTEIYVVKKGDTLHSISRKFSTDVDTIKVFNNLRSNNLKIGHVLKVPGGPVKYSKSGKLVYTVSKGDTLGTIAENFGVSVSSIKRENNLRSNKIYIGSNLTIPSKSTTRVAKTDTKSDATLVKYTVKKGDTLGSIARSHNTSVDTIKEANRLSDHTIFYGQRLKVPSKIKNRSDKVDTLIKVAKKYLGAPYKFGGTSTRTGIDCSAYVNKVFRSVDVNLPRTARAIYKKGHWVNKKHLDKGDLVFFRTYAKFPSHVGIYIGNGKFIHASSAKKKVTITDLNRRYYQKRYIGAKRIPLKTGLRYSKEFGRDGSS